MEKELEVISSTCEFLKNELKSWLHKETGFVIIAKN